MNPDLERIKDRISKLLAIADNDAAAHGEIDNAMRFATEMMLAHNLTRESITEMEDRKGRVEFGQHEAFTVGANFSCWEEQLVWFCTNFVGTCKFYYRSKVLRRDNGRTKLDDDGRPMKATKLTFYGPTEDAEFCSQLFEEMSLTIATMARLRWGGVFRGAGGSYCQGFVRGLDKAHTKVVQKLKEQNPETTALIVRSEQTAMVLREDASNWLKTDQGIRLRSAGSSSSGVGNKGWNADAHSEGVSDGKAYSVPGKATKQRNLV